ncbi:uncharacterized protein LOC129612011 [Condylostylus longicornis]|uniref:uncharacterized protein LOC129612011 n=1 Tax=Condylostylus longicornis TaxID=2530218 RepID=UPI00244DC627|nr:uncharacterized protein LOC129612011 [Condylostylus longicornis]
MIIELSIGIIIIAILIYKWLTSNFNYFEKLGIPYIKPIIIMGSFSGFLFKRESLREEFLRKYNDFKHLKVFGVFDGHRPVLVINDLDLLKKITIKDFEYFKNHKSFVDPEDDPISGNSLFALKNDKWHDMRITLSPAFTGSKMRLMFQLILDVCNKAVEYLEINAKENLKSDGGFEFEMKKFFTLCTNDAIASTAFGLEVNSLKDKNNEFYKMGQKFVTFSTLDIIKFVVYDTFKTACKLFGFKPVDQAFNNYFYRLVVDAMKYRKENNIIRQDMINMLMEAQSNPEKSHNREWTNEELVAQCSIFLFAGLESVSTTLCFATQELIEHPDVQERLREEIDSVNEKLNGGPLTYEILKEMKYMEMVVSEVLRKWPPFIQSDRVCTKPYEIDEDDLKLKLNVDDVIWIPIAGIQMNENNFENPTKFDPERFNDENKSNLKQMSFSAFGYGPRICIGSRLALLECKALLFYILKNFKLEPCKKTKIPVELDPINFPVTVKGGFWLKMIPRNFVSKLLRCLYCELYRNKMIFEIIVGVLIIVFLIYKWLTLNYEYFEKLGIPYVKPKIFMGSFYGFVFKKESFRDEFLRTYNDFKNYKVYGAFEGRNPIYIINDLNLLKKITIKDFEHFKNRRDLVDPEDDPLFGSAISAMKDDKWHDMRVTLSPAFTGNKMRLMFQLILDISERAVNYLKMQVNTKDGIEFEMKNFFTLYTTDAIASTAFGLEVNSLKEKDNEFYKMGQRFINFSTVDIIKFMIYSTFKRICKIIRFKPMNQTFYEYFSRLVLDSMKYRKENNIVRQDMINMLMEAQSNPEKSHNRKWTDEELVAQCSIFLFAGLESVSTTLCFSIQELVENQDVQEKLRKEIDAVNEELNGEPITYEKLKSMKYMDMFLSEVLRKWPPFIQSDRVCTKPYEIDEDDLKLQINVGDVIWIPIVGIQMNENNFENPLKFDPERFNDENKSYMDPMSFVSFGHGPRICIGSRLALIECKALLFNILSNFKLNVCQKTKIPVELEPINFPVTVKGGFWVQIVPRK